jgi:hypothetical protein
VADPTTRVPARRAPVPEDAVAAVFARAAELDLQQAPGAAPVLLDEDALVEIGAAVGLTPDAVRQAVAEHRAGALVPAPPVPPTWAGPRLALAERRIPGDPGPVRRAVEHALERQWFRRVRGQDERSVWVARDDLQARVARRVDFRHRLVLQGVTTVVVTTVACDGADSTVRIEADPTERRRDLGWSVAGLTTGGATAGFVLALLAGVDPDPALLLSLPSAGLGAGGGVVRARRSYVGQLRGLVDDLEGILDRAHRGG